LEKGRPDEEERDIFHVNDNYTVVLTDMCKAAVVLHLKATGTQLADFSRTMDYFGLSASTLMEYDVYVSMLHFQRSCPFLT
jgi:hypothetical protein